MIGRRKILAWVGGAIALVFVFLFLGSVAYFRWLWGPGYNPNNARDIQKLFIMANGTGPLRGAVEQYRRDHGAYPMAITNLYPAYLHITPTSFPHQEPVVDPFQWARWTYERQSTNAYSLRYELSWDDRLIYEYQAGGTDQWWYTGSDTDIDLTRKFQLCTNQK